MRDLIPFFNFLLFVMICFSFYKLFTFEMLSGLIYISFHMCFMNLCLGCSLNWVGGKAIHWEGWNNVMVHGSYIKYPHPKGFI